MTDELGDALKRARDKELRDGLTAAAERQAASERGSAAPTFTGWRGEWATGRPYQRGNVVSHEGSSWRALADHDSSEPPSQMWEYVAKKGEKGERGPRGSDGIGASGPQGPPGPQGPQGDPGPGSEMEIEDEGVAQGTATTLDFVGPGVSAVVAAGVATVTIPGSTTTIDGHVIEDEGTPLTQRTNLNFVGAGVTVTDSAPDTIVTIAGGSGAPSYLSIAKWGLL